MLKCLFPYDNDPHQPGPKPHYCLVADIPFSVGDQHYVAVAYGTSKLDENLLRAHRGLILRGQFKKTLEGLLTSPATC